MSPAPGSIRQLWYKWKSLKLPWRRQWLVGFDLAGNTFWEFKDSLNSNRFRRIMKYRRHTHYGDVNISPQWHQWLRHTRLEVPTIQEQQYEVSRQSMMKQLAARADERWRSVPSYLDSPDRQQPQPAVGVNDPPRHAPQTETEQHRRATNARKDAPEVQEGDAGEGKRGVREDQLRGRPREKEEAPWAKNIPKGGPSENWQPEVWTPGVIRRR